MVHSQLWGRSGVRAVIRAVRVVSEGKNALSVSKGPHPPLQSVGL